MNAFNFAQKLWRKTAAGPTNDPMAAINAKRVADMKAMAAQVRTASGTPNPTGNGANGQHSWSGRVMPGGAVQGAKYTPPAAAASSAQQPASFAAAKPMPPRSSPSPTPPRPMPPRPMPSAPVPSQQQPQPARAQIATYSPPQPPTQNSTSGGPSMFQRAMSVIPGASAWGNQTGGSGPISAPLSNTSTAFNNATGQQDPAHIITTDNGRKFNTQTKQFLDGQPGGFGR
jgi:hypothetical protein